MICVGSSVGFGVVVGYFVVGVRWLLIVVFVAAAVGKLRHRGAWQDFRASLRALNFFPARWLVPVSVTMVALEVAAVLLLAVGDVAVVGLELAAALLAAFGLGIAIAKWRGALVPCRCFAGSGPLLGWRQVIRNGGLSALAAVASVSAGAAPIAGAVLAAAAGGLAGLFVVVEDDLVALFGPASVGKP